ncbi:TatD family hydrolase, partial [Francisellaceae bacterium]|nr:TatD family hydrolase [Francisellaceae bacterium]
MFIDSHCHLDFDVFSEDLSNLINQCENQNITQFIIPSIGKQNWHSVISLCARENNFTPALGIHPCFISDHELDTDIDNLELTIIENKVKILGEIGLDKRYKETFDTQKLFFSKQIQLAKQLEIPVLIHSVKAHTEIIAAIKSSKFDSGGIIHAFNGSLEIAQIYINLGFKLGIGGLITYTQNKKLLQVVSHLPLTSFVLETDSPDMPIFNQDRSQPNTPLNLVHIFSAFCECRNE